MRDGANGCCGDGGAGGSFGLVGAGGEGADGGVRGAGGWRGDEPSGAALQRGGVRPRVAGGWRAQVAGAVGRGARWRWGLPEPAAVPGRQSVGAGAVDARGGG